VNVNERTVVSLSAVWSCLKILSDTIAGIENHVYRKTAVGAADIEVELPDVLVDPYGPDLTARGGVVQSVVSLGLNGNLFRTVIDRDEDGNPAQLQLLNPGLITTKLVGGVKTYTMGALGQPLNAKNILHTKFLELPGSVVGLNPIEAGGSMFGIAQAAEEYASRFYAQGINPGGILSINKPLLPADAIRYQQELATNHAGLANTAIPLVIDAETKWQQISVNPQTAMLLESRQFSKGEIASFYGVPLAFLADDSARGSTEIKGVEELLITFVLTGVKGFVDRLNEADTLLLPPGYYAKRDINDVYKANSQVLSMMMMVLRNGSIATPNELRRYVNLPPVTEDGADSLFAPLNSATADWERPGGGAVTAPSTDPTATISPSTAPNSTVADDDVDIAG
jgi:HK97 family phage portal protein